MTSLEAAQEWVTAVLAGDAETAWRQTEPVYRRAIAERRAQTGVDDDPVISEEVVRTFTEEGRDTWAWRSFAEAQREVFEHDLPEEWRAFRDGGGQLSEEWRAFARANQVPEEGRLWSWFGPRMVADDCELVQVIDATELVPEGVDNQAVASIRIESGSLMFGSIDFYMRRGEAGEWLLAGLRECPPDWLDLDTE
jgi:hypothetical protein